MKKIIEMIELNEGNLRAQLSWAREGLRLKGYNNSSIDKICANGLKSAIQILSKSL